MPNTSREYKDRLFRFLFGRPERKDYALSLYNAVNQTDYQDPDELIINTIEDAVYLGMKNDVSFLFRNHLNVYEQQSSYNPNMPLRFLGYVSSLMDKYVTENREDKYSSRLISLPEPRLIVFYNGRRMTEERQILKLSDAYFHRKGHPMVEVEVIMYNINRGNNEGIMERCPVLFEYSWVVDTYRRNVELYGEDTFDRVLEDMPLDFTIRPLLTAHKAEVSGMLLKDYTEQEREEVLEYSLKREREEGLKEGKREAESPIVRHMSEQGSSEKEISALTGISLEDIRNYLK